MRSCFFFLAILSSVFLFSSASEKPKRYQTGSMAYGDQKQPVMDAAKELNKRKKEYEEISATLEDGASLRLYFPENFAEQNIEETIGHLRALYKEAYLFSGRPLMSNLVIRVLVVEEYPANYRYLSPVYYVPTYDNVVFVKKGIPLSDCEKNGEFCRELFFNVPHEMAHEFTQDLFVKDAGRWLEDGLCELFSMTFAKKRQESIFLKKITARSPRTSLQTAGKAILEWRDAETTRREIIKKTADAAQGVSLLDKLGPGVYYSAAYQMASNLEACLGEKGKRIADLLERLRACAPCPETALREAILELAGREPVELLEEPCPQK